MLREAVRGLRIDLAYFRLFLSDILNKRRYIVSNNDIMRWNYIAKVGLPPDDEYGWLLVKTNLEKSLPHIAKLVNGKWWSINIISIGPMEDVLNCKVIAWADMTLIKDEEVN